MVTSASFFFDEIDEIEETELEELELDSNLVEVVTDDVSLV